MAGHWKPQTAAGGNAPLSSLMNRAADALRREDKRLADAIHRGRATHERAFAPVGRGLAHPLYETTIVYLIWRAWVDAGFPAAWDWSVAKLTERTADRTVRGKQIDLTVFGSGQQRDHLFEVKSWSYAPGAMCAAIESDAEKLRKVARVPLLSKARKCILLFGHEPRARSDEHLVTFCKTAGLRVLGKAAFSSWRGFTRETESPGRFALTALQVVG